MTDIKLEMLSSPGCHNCEKFLTYWETIKEQWPNVEFVDISVTTPDGQELAKRHVVMSSPGIILNGELFSTGGVNQEEFLQKLKELSQ